MKSYDIEPLVVSPETENITDLLEVRVANTPDLALFSIEETAGRWVDISAKDFHSKVTALAKGLVAAGIQPGQAVGIMSRTRYEWTLIDFAIWYAGAVSVPIYESSAPSQMEWILSDSDAVALFVENAEHFERFEQIKAGAPLVHKVWTIESDAIEQLIKVGRDIADATIETKRKSAKLRDLATIIDSSGADSPRLRRAQQERDFGTPSGRCGRRQHLALLATGSRFRTLHRSALRARRCQGW